MLPYANTGRTASTENGMVLGPNLHLVVALESIRGTLSATWAVAHSRVPPPPTQQGSVQSGPLLRIRSQRITQIQKSSIPENAEATEF